MSEKIYQFPSGHSVSVGSNNTANPLEKIDNKNFRVHIESATLRKTIWITHVGNKRILSWPGGSVDIDALDVGEQEGAGGGKIKPLKLTMPGKVLAIKATAGETVEIGQAILVVEAMKMENILLATARAKIAKIHCQVGDRVNAGTVLVSFES
jgi:acetyl/propionyl-CoA carboxylase alpha subunit